MNDALVQNMGLLDEQAMHIHSAEMQTIWHQMQTSAESHYTKWQRLHVNLSIHKCIQTDFVGGMPQTHFKMLREERTHCFVQNEEEEKSVDICQ